MTESEWPTATDPHAMVAHFQREECDRKGRLLAVACCRLIDHLMSDSEGAAVTAGESFADGNVSGDELAARRDEVEDLRHGVSQFTSDAARYATYGHPIGPWPTLENVIWAAMCNGRQEQEFYQLFSSDRWREEYKRLQITSAQCDLLRCIFGNPFRPVAFSSSWRSETVVALASGIYAERAFDRLPILADALEEAGCDHADVFSHCRGSGPHARGCWVVDGVLAK